MQCKRWLSLWLGMFLFTIACGLSERATLTPDAVRDAARTARAEQVTATNMAQETRFATLNATIVVEVSATTTAQAQELRAKLAEMSLELQFTPSGSRAESWITRWLTHPACQPPCWENITPGTTTLEEAARIVYQIPGTEITSLPSVPGLLDVEKSLTWKMDQTDYGYITAWGDQELVPSIGFRLADEQNLLLGQVVAAFGDPSAVARGDCVDSIPVRCSYVVVYKDKGMLLYTDYLTSKVVDIQADTKINLFILYPLDRIESQAGSKNLAWSGYGKYDFRDK